ncbi:hypothetical protein EMIT0158MI4_220060 [Burkholderia ambifaria]
MLGARFLRGSAVPLARLRRPLGQGSGLPDRRAVGAAAVIFGFAPARLSHMRRPMGGALLFGIG